MSCFGVLDGAPELEACVFLNFCCPGKKYFRYNLWKHVVTLCEWLLRKSSCLGSASSYGLILRMEAVAWDGWRRFLSENAGPKRLLWDIVSA